MMRSMLMMTLVMVFLFSAVHSAVVRSVGGDLWVFQILFSLVRVVRSPQEEEAANPFWWCDPTQPGYAFYLVQGIKDWCAENAWWFHHPSILQKKNRNKQNFQIYSLIDWLIDLTRTLISCILSKVQQQLISETNREEKELSVERLSTKNEVTLVSSDRSSPGCGSG